MNWHDFKEFFEVGTEQTPFSYQRRFAENEKLATVLSVPTGCGKTAAIMLAWLWRRFLHPNEEIRKKTPRRLVYCLPMRVLVEQTCDTIKEILGRLQEHDHCFGGIRVVSAMGGDYETDWMNNPELNQIIIGTQDILLSAALNRGYAISRFRWPHAFALLNNDCFWCFDEIQLMGSGLPTSLQLEAFRNNLSVYKNTTSVWMSATIEKDWFQMPDYRGVTSGRILTLDKDDLGSPLLKKRMQAIKTMSKGKVAGRSTKKKHFESLAKEVLSAHVSNTLTIVILNQVNRAQDFFRQLEKIVPDDVELLLVHSRFRGKERSQLNNRMKTEIDPKGRILVSTQVIEAGVDISASTLFTELAPWSSLVQRFGRCNRYGEYDDGRVFWWDVNQKDYFPYSSDEMNLARETLQMMEGKSMSPEGLPKITSKIPFQHIIRSKDIIDLFDTSSDLSGNDVDVSRFIRDNDGMDVKFFWGVWEDKRPKPEISQPDPDELCSVHLFSARQFLDSCDSAWRWDTMDSQWRRINSRDLYPGMTILLHRDTGGYSPIIGWTGSANDTIPITTSSKETMEGIDEDPLTFSGRWMTLAEHTDMVVKEIMQLIKDLDISVSDANLLIDAARWHDSGKAHSVFQNTMSRTGQLPKSGEIWAKSASGFGRHSQPRFRHELASALCYLSNNGPYPSDLVAYLVAAHHGKVRLSIRSWPGEKAPDTCPQNTRIARGVWDKSRVFAANLGGGIQLKDTVMDLSLLEMGTGSWLERTLHLLEQWGPFRLAYLESLVRAADIRASMK